ncbi:MAG: hypothetical protein KC492_27250 [Myxococcales bacterium]|nr:hypothetical protein [Myxococcales bacterium]
MAKAGVRAGEAAAAVGSQCLGAKEVMKHTFTNVQELFEAMEGGLDIYDLVGAFVDRDKWTEQPSDAELVFWDEDDLYVNDDAGLPPEEEVDGVPSIAANEGLRYLLLSTQLIDVFEVLKGQSKSTDVAGLVRVINHYRTRDSFEP